MKIWKNPRSGIVYANNHTRSSEVVGLVALHLRLNGVRNFDIREHVVHNRSFEISKLDPSEVTRVRKLVKQFAKKLKFRTSWAFYATEEINDRTRFERSRKGNHA